MLKSLLTDGCKWLDPVKFKLNKYEVDLKYLRKLHKLHKDYSLAPEKLEIKRGILSDYQ